MEHLKDVFRRNGLIYDGSTEMAYKLFRSAIYANDVETMKALIFLGSPVLSAEINDSLSFPLLHTLILYNPNIVIAQFLIDHGVDIDKKNPLDETALHLTVSLCMREDLKDDEQNEQLNMLKVLLQNGANRELRDNENYTPIQLCLFNGKLELAEEFLKEEDKLPNVIEVDRAKRCCHLVKCLLKEKNDWNRHNTNYSILLHFLINENDEKTFEYVVKNTKFDVNASTECGDTLLHFAVEKGRARMVRMLINIGADPDDASPSLGSPLMIAMKETRTEIFHFLLDRGASVNKIYEDDDLLPEGTHSPLHYAVCVQSLEMVEKLVKLGADVNALTYYRSPLLLACGSVNSSKCSSDLDDVFNDITKYLYEKNMHNCPFSVKIVEFLLDHGADIEAKNPLNRTSLDQACKFGRLDIVKLLLSRGAKINQGDVSTLHHAVRGENPVIVKLILDQGANVNYRCAPEKMLRDNPDYESPPPRTPLECALEFILEDSKCRDIIEVLFQYDVNVNVSDPVRSETPLHLACFSNKTDNFINRKLPDSRPATIKLLLRHNANVNALDGNGLTPLHYALRNYTLVNGQNNRQRFSKMFRADLVALIAIIAIIIEKKEYVIKKNLVLLEDTSVRPIYQQCLKELSLMKKNICRSRNFSFFSILFKDIQYLGSALKNMVIFRVLNSGAYKKKLPVYAKYLKDRIVEASIRQRLVDLSIVLFQKHVNKNISVELMLNVFKFFNLDDFKNFTKACFVDVKGK